eukprot:31794-Prorocentrum_minimum.AAC.2
METLKRSEAHALAPHRRSRDHLAVVVAFTSHRLVSHFPAPHQNCPRTFTGQIEFSGGRVAQKEGSMAVWRYLRRQEGHRQHLSLDGGPRPPRLILRIINTIMNTNSGVGIPGSYRPAAAGIVVVVVVDVNVQDDVVSGGGVVVHVAVGLL